MSAKITLANVSFKYSVKDNWALEKINLEFNCNQKTAILGGNGSGKTTLAKLLNGLLLPKEGAVSLGNLQTGNPEHLILIRSKIGILFQNPENQIVAATVEEEVAFGARNLGLVPTEVDQRVSKALRFVGLGHCRSALTNQLSGGELQKLALAGILVMEPRYLVMDESLAMLDGPSKTDLLELLDAYHARNQLGIIAITHDLSELPWFHRAIVMSKGRVVYDGEPVTLLSGEVPMQNYGLELPPLLKVAQGLRRRGIVVPPTIRDRKELVMWIVDQVRGS